MHTWTLKKISSPLTGIVDVLLQAGQFMTKKKKIPKYLVLPHRFPVLICNPSHPTLNRGRGSPGRWVCFPVREPKAFWEAAFLPSFSFGGNCWLVAAPQWMGQVVKAETIAHSHICLILMKTEWVYSGARFTSSSQLVLLHLLSL